MNAVQALSGDLKAERRKYKTQPPDYTRGEEITNMITHILGALFAVAAIPISAPETRRIPSAISRAVCSETAPYASRVSSRTPRYLCLAEFA